MKDIDVRELLPGDRVKHRFWPQNLIFTVDKIEFVKKPRGNYYFITFLEHTNGLPWTELILVDYQQGLEKTFKLVCSVQNKSKRVINL